MILKKCLAILCMLLFYVMSAHADITTTSQNLEEFSFKKG